MRVVENKNQRLNSYPKNNCIITEFYISILENFAFELYDTEFSGFQRFRDLKT
jgi:hypothetical protein